MEIKRRKSAMPQEIIILGRRIEQLITESGKTRREVAIDADIEVENLRKYIKGKQEMKVSTLLKIANALDVTPGELFLTSTPVKGYRKKKST